MSEFVRVCARVCECLCPAVCASVHSCVGVSVVCVHKCKGLSLLVGECLLFQKKEGCYAHIGLPVGTGCR